MATIALSDVRPPHPLVSEHPDAQLHLPPGSLRQLPGDIPIRYPLVELATSLLWGGLFLAYFVAQWQATPFGWQQGLGAGVSDLAADWPVYVLHALFASALLAASAIDADLFIIRWPSLGFLAILAWRGPRPSDRP